MNAAKLLSARGFLVDVYGIQRDDVIPGRLPAYPNVRWIYLGVQRRDAGRVLLWLRFAVSVVFRAVVERYGGIIGYDMLAAGPGYLSARLVGATWVYQNHDLQRIGDVRGFYVLFQKLEHLAARKADLVVFPQGERADVFATEARLSRAPIVACNAPCSDWYRESADDPDVSALRRITKKLVVYQGGLARARGVVQLVKSMQLWSQHGGLVLVGPEIERGIVNHLRALVGELGLSGRVLILPAKPYHSLPGITRQCDVGVGVLASPRISDCFNLAHLTGASNKLFEYMACGLPVVVPSTPENELAIRRGGYGLTCDPDKVESIADALASLLQNESKSAAMSSKAVRDFRQIWNYDLQFERIASVFEDL